MTEREKKIGLAITSLIFGIIALLGSCFLLNIILGPLAIIFGIIALVKASKHPETHGGQVLGGIGLALGVVSLATLPIVAAIAIPNLLNAVQRGKQIRTVQAMEKLARTLESYHNAENRYPDSGGFFTPLSEITALKEKAGVTFPTTDGWGRELLYWADSDGRHYLLVSPGKDGRKDAMTYEEYKKLAKEIEKSREWRANFDRDIVMEDGQFLINPRDRK